MPSLLMPKATAVWLIDNTTLTFEQISEFCDLHILEVQAIADSRLSNAANRVPSAQYTEKTSVLKFSSL